MPKLFAGRGNKLLVYRTIIRLASLLLLLMVKMFQIGCIKYVLALQIVGRGLSQNVFLRNWRLSGRFLSFFNFCKDHACAL